MDLYLECYAGISGDMLVASLLDLGASEDKLNDVLTSIPTNGFKTEITKVKKNGIDACDFNVILDIENHDHDMEYLHHDHHEHQHGYHHEHNSLKHIMEIIDGTKMSDNAKSISKQIFNILAESEAKAHGIDIKDVHFHEVGAIDSIVDIISIAACIDDLNINNVYVSDLYEGKGYLFNNIFLR